MRAVIFHGGTFSLLVVSLVLTLSCVCGPKTEHKTALDVLNGENYETSAQGSDRVVVPIVKARERDTRLSGTVVTSEDDFEIPLRFVAIGVFSPDGQRLAEGATDSDGKFKLAAPLNNGEYSLQVISTKYSGERQLSIESYEIKGLVIRAKLKPGR